MDKKDITRRARLVIDQHGAGAEVHAAKLAERWEMQGEEPVASMWRQIGAAIEVLRRA